jgi:cystathionine beta-lyase
MTYDFDTVIDRYGTDCIKYDFAKERGKPEGLLPLWVADMDFPAPPEVLEDIRKTVEHGIFGYTEAKQDFYDAVSGWFQRRFGYDVSREDVVKTPGTVYALAMAVRAFTEPGDGVIIQPPVYYPFYEVVRDNGRGIIRNPLAYRDGAYSMDYDDLERKAADGNAKLLILCSPHNPVSRVWTQSELQTLSDICKRHGVTVVSDEIHCDFVFEGYTHAMFGHFDENAVICTAPTKTFNVAGLQIANIFVKNAALRHKLKMEIRRSGYSQLNAIGLAACKSAYLRGGEWLRQLKEYLAGNIEYVRGFLAEQLPQIKLVEPEGTYLLWLDCRALGLPQAELDALVTNKAKLWLDGGTMFGEEGESFQRMNIACPRETLKQAMVQLENAVKL